MEMTLEQKKAIAMANARLRLQSENQGYQAGVPALQ